ncbi:DUF4397 domain-containing protein [Micromonospora sp. WMMA1998]|uniref:DUF4397 domain-containing protein n=1 Tax=Micromonospora sediminicola TaxID=946078 RepID=A0A1A9BGP6_9ACTN|nr:MULTISPECIES: DUF4397 domain-containing protein [Micromonospora]ATO14603.1 DUF4397 domain-containing protein [Micromonospora sp. WMMA2032]PGH43107.1 DUF4397 domain-containing protein [Micromonospora sp. WMMA1996]WBC14394.1 DUF4397 domain-containing protein [Micromonospora sp. WMMA1998]SBT68353.1 protein of unknown function (DUF4397) [Micromonospora sediminicola]
MQLAMFRRVAAGGAVAALTFAGVGAATMSPAYAASSKVSVVHGIPDTPVDVYVNGKKTLDNFKPGDVAGPLTLPEGEYDIALTKPGEAIDKAILKVDDAEVPGGANISLAAHLSADGKPQITPFVNDVSKVGAGKARLIVRHTAAAPAVDVRAGGKPVFEGLTNPKEAKADVAAGSVKADVVLAGTDTVAIGPADLNLKEGTATIVYAIGSADAKNLDLVAQTISGLHSAPGGVPSGTGGQAGTGVDTWWYVLAGAGVLLLVGGGARVATARAGRR